MYYFQQIRCGQSTKNQLNPSFDGPKTAELFTHFGVFVHLRMPFGLHSAVQTFQRFVDQVLSGLSISFAYIDDIIALSTCRQDQEDHVKMIMGSLSISLNSNSVFRR